VGRSGAYRCMHDQTTYYFRASREPMGFGPATVEICDPQHKHQTREEAEACPIRERTRDGETFALEVIVTLNR
jgi:hypothetical protein